jgi:mono/diheme cytochrome c family protein
MPSRSTLLESLSFFGLLHSRPLLLVTVAVLCALPALTAAPDTTYEGQVRPLLLRYCISCHQGTKPQGGLDLAAYQDEKSVLRSPRTWKKVWDVLHAREMPPEGKPQPTPAERERLTDWIGDVLSRPAADGHRDPGRPVVRRLNATEYNNTVYDLFDFNRPGTYFDPRQGRLPEPVRLVLHLIRRPALVDLPPDDADYGYDNNGEVLSLPPFLMERYLAAARHIVDLALGKVPPTGKDAAMGKGVQRSRLFNIRGDHPPDREEARRLLSTFAERAFRRPVPAPEVERYLKLYDLAAAKGEPFDTSLSVPLQAILVSPHFLFRPEGSGSASTAKGVIPLTDFELATRLSYFLWSTMPDAELFNLARQGRLRQPEVLEQQARRMLRSSKAKELAENFALQWLQLTRVTGAMPDPARFPQFYRLKSLPIAMRQEALLLFESVMIEDRSILDLIDADFAYLNSTLAQFYGIPPVDPNGQLWHRYALPDKRRGGVLTLAAVLTTTSSSTRTSPVKRGKWVLETILGAPPPPPLPNVPDLDNAPAGSATTLRQKLEQHRADPNCASCHRRMDPIGLGFENFDAIGAWRDKEGDAAINPSATLADGTTLNGPGELKKLLRTARKDDFVRCLTEHMLRYSLGRRLEYYDAGTVQEIGKALAKKDYRFSELVVEIVKSYPFRYRKNG